MIGADPIRIEPDLCLNRRLKEQNCRQCERICPQSALRVDACMGMVHLEGSCTGCGLCIAACPAQAIRWTDTARFPLTSADGAVEVYCTRLKCDGYAACLANLDAAEMAYLGLMAQVRLIVDRSLCAACNPAVRTHIEAQRKLANAFLAKLQLQPIALAEKVQANAERINRREMLGFFFTKVKQTIAKALPIPDEASGSRRLLVHALRRNFPGASGDASPLFWGLRVAGGCTLCGACARACRNNALGIVRAEENDCVQLRHDPSMCTGCGVCGRVCPQNIMEVSEAFSDLALIWGKKWRVAAAKSLTPCSVCGARMIEDEARVCLSCERQRKRKPQSIY